MKEPNNEIVIYQNAGRNVRINVLLEGELMEHSVVRDFLTTACNEKTCETNP